MRKSFTILAFLLLSLTSFSQQLSDSLLLFYPLDGNANDVSVNGFDGIINGATPTVDRNGNPNGAFSFDGIDDFIEWPNDSSLKPGFPYSFSFWVQIDTINPQSNGFFSTNYGASNYYGTWMQYNNGLGVLSSVGGGLGSTAPSNRRTKDSSTNLTTNTWYHIAAIIRGPLDMDVYVDCSLLQGTYNGSGPLNVVYSNLTSGSLGRIHSGFYFDGSMDDFMYWNRELSLNEISQLCQSQAICVETFYDTNIIDVFDTTRVMIYDTTIIEIFDTITVVDTIHVGDPNGKTEFGQGKFKVYPNPTNETVYITNEEFTELEFYRLRIVNAEGRELLIQSVSSSSIEINLKALGFSSGLYIMQLIDDNSLVVEQYKVLLN